MKKKKGYVLVYSVIAMLLTCALVLSTVTIILYYGNNVNRTVGGNGALYVADSGISSFEDYLNAYYVDKGNIKTNAEDLWITVYDIVEEIVPVIGEGQSDKALLAVQGYLQASCLDPVHSKGKCQFSNRAPLSAAWALSVSACGK